MRPHNEPMSPCGADDDMTDSSQGLGVPPQRTKGDALYSVRRPEVVTTMKSAGVDERGYTVSTHRDEWIALTVDATTVTNDEKNEDVTTNAHAPGSNGRSKPRGDDPNLVDSDDRTHMHATRTTNVNNRRRMKTAYRGAGDEHAGPDEGRAEVKRCISNELGYITRYCKKGHTMNNGKHWSNQRAGSPLSSRRTQDSNNGITDDDRSDDNAYSCEGLLTEQVTSTVGAMIRMQAMDVYEKKNDEELADRRTDAAATTDDEEKIATAVETCVTRSDQWTECPDAGECDVQ